MNRLSRIAVGACLAWASLMAAPCWADFYLQTNLVTDNQALAPAPVTDPNLVNPWGMSSSPGGPVWVSNNNSGTATIYDGNGNPKPLVVTIPGFGGQQGSPTGQVFNPKNAFSQPWRPAGSASRCRKV